MTNCIRALPGDIAILIAEKSSFYQAICLAYLSHKNCVKEAVRKRIVQERYGPFEELIVSYNFLSRIHTNDMEGWFPSVKGKIVDMSRTVPSEDRKLLSDVYRRLLARQESQEVKNLDQYLSSTHGKDLFYQRITTLFVTTAGIKGIENFGRSYWLILGKGIHFTYIQTPLIGGKCDIRFQQGVAVFLSRMLMHVTLNTAIIFAEIFYKDPREKVVVKCDQTMRNAFYAMGLLPYEITREQDLKDALSNNRPFAYCDSLLISEITLSKKVVAKPFYEERRKKHLAQGLITNWDPEIFRRYLYKRPASRNPEVPIKIGV